MASLEPTHRQMQVSESDFEEHLKTMTQKRPSQGSLELTAREIGENNSFAITTHDNSRTFGPSRITDPNIIGGPGVRIRPGDSQRGSGKDSLRDNSFTKPNIRLLVTEARKRMTKAAEDGVSQERASFEDRTTQSNRIIFKPYKALSPVKLKSISFMDKFDKRKRSDDKSKSPVKMDPYRAATPTRARPNPSPLPYKTEDFRERAQPADTMKEELANLKMFSARYL
jgi:hypothetical protein